MDTATKLVTPDNTNAASLRSAIKWDAYAQRIHNNAVEKGFWPPEGRNFGEMICLVHSEIAEAYEAALDRLPDDKLCMYSGFSVEIADAIIRLLDTGHSRGISFQTGLYVAGMDTVSPYASLEQDLMQVHTKLSLALEADRKDRRLNANAAIISAVALLLSISAKYGIDIVAIIEAKMSYNASRPFKHGKAY